MEIRDFLSIMSIFISMTALAISLKAMTYGRFRAYMNIRDKNLDAAISDINTRVGRLHSEIKNEAFSIMKSKIEFINSVKSNASASFNIDYCDINLIKDISKINIDVDIRFNLRNSYSYKISIFEMFSSMVITSSFSVYFMAYPYIAAPLIGVGFAFPLYALATSRYDCFTEMTTISFRKNCILVFNTKMGSDQFYQENKIKYTPSTSVLFEGKLMEIARKFPLMGSVIIRDEESFFNIIGFPNWYRIFFRNDLTNIVNKINVIINIFSIARAETSSVSAHEPASK